jgi:hypothetical protein
MKYSPLALPLASALLFAQCAKTPELSPAAPKIDYNQRSAENIQGARPPYGN